MHFPYQAYKSVTIPAPSCSCHTPLAPPPSPDTPLHWDTCLWELVAPKEEGTAAAGAGLTLQVSCGQQGVLSHVIVDVTILVTLMGTVFIVWVWLKWMHNDQ